MAIKIPTNLVKNFNAKIRRLTSKGIKEDFLPRRITKADLSNPSVVDFAKNFLNRGNQRWQVGQVTPKGELISKKELSELKRLQATANRRRLEYRTRNNAKTFIIASELVNPPKAKTERTVSEDRYVNPFRPLSKSKFSSRGEYLEYIEKVKSIASSDFSDKQNDEMKRRFLKAVRKNLNDQELYESLEKLDSEYIANVLDTTDIDIKYAYGEDEHNAKIAFIKAVFKV